MFAGTLERQKPYSRLTFAIPSDTFIRGSVCLQQRGTTYTQLSWQSLQLYEQACLTLPNGSVERLTLFPRLDIQPLTLGDPIALSGLTKIATNISEHTVNRVTRLQDQLELSISTLMTRAISHYLDVYEAGREGDQVFYTYADGREFRVDLPEESMPPFKSTA